jgi:hypothetical protein
MAGNMERIDRFIEELGNDDPEVQDDAIKKLEKIGDHYAIIALVKCLDDNKWRQAKGFDPNWRGPQGESLQGRNVYEPLSYLASKALARLVPNPPVNLGKEPITMEHVKKWKTWWEKNRSYYMEGDKSL